MKNKIKYFILFPLMLLIVILTLTYDVKELIGLGQRIPFGSSYWKDSLVDAISTNKSIKLGTGDSIYYNGVVVTSGTGGGGIAASDNITFTGRDSTAELWRFGDSVRFYEHVLFKDTLKVSGAIAVMDSLKVSKNLWFNNTTKLSTTLNTFYILENAFQWQNQNAYNILDLDSSNGMNLHYGVYTGNGSGLTNVDAITLKGQDTTHFAHTDTLTTERVKAKTEFSDVVTFFLSPVFSALVTFANGINVTGNGVFSGNITADTLKGKGNQITGVSRIIPFSAAVLTTWADSTTYYFGNYPSISPSTTEATHKFYMPCSGSIKGCILSVYKGGTAGSAQNVTVYLRINGSDNLVTSTMQWTTASNYDLATNYSLSIPFVAGDYLTFKIITPNWNPTNPLNCMVSATIYYQ